MFGQVQSDAKKRFYQEEAKGIFATHSDESDEIKDPEGHLESWSKRWLTLLDIIHQLSNKSSFEIVKLRQVPSTLSQLKKWSFSHVFSDEAILTPNVEEDSTVKNV